MIYIFISFILYAFRTPIEKEPCQYKNTIVGPNGFCMCKPGFVGPPTIGKTGCWRCLPKCHSDATCNLGGQCKCKEGFEGDGVMICQNESLIYSTIEYISPKEAYYDSKETVVIRLAEKPSHSIRSIFVRFDNQISICDNQFFLSDNDSLPTSLRVPQPPDIKCQLPYSVPGMVVVSVSFDAKKWSKNGKSFEFLAKPFYLRHSKEVIFVISFVFLYLVLTKNIMFKTLLYNLLNALETNVFNSGLFKSKKNLSNHGKIEKTSNILHFV